MKLKLCILGCGKASEKHLKVYKALSEDVEVVAVCDLNSKRAEAFAKELGSKVYTDFQEMLKREDIDVVDLALPSGLHGEVGKTILRKFRKHLLVEKPLALTLREAEELINLSEKHKLKLVTIFQNRANLPVLKLKELLEKGLFGRLVLVSARFYWKRDQAYYDSADWRGTWAQDGGALAQQGCHFVDMMTFLGGEVEEVFARMKTYLAKIEAEDLLVGTVKFRNGALGTIEATTCARPKDIKAEFVLLGEKGSAILGGFSLNRLDYLALEGLPEIDMSPFEKNPENPVGFALYEYLKSAILYFRDDLLTPYLSIGSDALKSLEVILGLYESAERGRPVRLPFKPKYCRLGKKVSYQQVNREVSG